MEKHDYPIAAALALSMFAVYGCDRGDLGTAAPHTAQTSADASRGDERLATYVEARYQADTAIAAHDIDVTARDGVITLRGTVSSDAARSQAETLARDTSGVRSVENLLTVEPRTNPGEIIAANRPVDTRAPSTTSGEGREPFPAWITTNIQARYFGDDAVKGRNVDVTTRGDGSVTLRGEVDNAAAREAAERIARETEGVTRVDNQLRVKGDTAPSSGGGTQVEDAWLTAKVQSKYFLDEEVKGRRIDVDTRDGVVTLSGEVATPAQRRHAVALARNTEGVRSVNDQLQVTPASADGARTAASPEGRDSRSTQPVEDGWITTKVQAQFFLDGDIKARDIDVDTRNGVVTLKGVVGTDAEKQMAGDIAEDTQGVARVVNELSISAREPQ